ncbi:hypothetical protein FRB93_004830 [Tulasnella sp. JGI-2019a]|nr:hypothetical protein FRB93_004830 [Tulasnella sp. JGI-2019a]
MLPRFRKKSDAKRPSVSLTQHVQPPQSPPAASSRLQWQAPLTLLPASDDFRTSLILPDLSRRFSLLRQPDGRPVGIEDVREKFAEQRNHGSVNVITEEEEEYVINYLKGAGHMPGGVVDDRHTADERNAFPSSIPHTPLESVDAYGEAVVPHSAFQSTFPHSPPTTKEHSPLSPAFSTSSSRGYPSSPLTPSPTTSRASNGSYSSKRLSSNLFGSGRFRDQSYMRSASKKQTSNRSLRELARQHAAGSGEGDASRSQAGTDEEHGDLIEEQGGGSHEGTVGVVGQALSTPMGEEEPSDGEGFSGDMSKPVTPPGSQMGRAEAFQTSDDTSFPLNFSVAKSLQDDTGSTTPQGSPQNTNGRSRARGGPVMFTPGQVHRASLALEEVIRNFEQDDSAEEQILTPRSISGIHANSIANGHHTHPWVKSPSLPVVRPLLPEGKPTHLKTMGSTSLQPHDEIRMDMEPGTPPTPSGGQYVFAQPSHQYVKSSPSGSPRHPWQGGPPPPSSPGARAVSPLSPGSPRVPGYRPGMQRPISPPRAQGHDGSIDKAFSPTSSTSRKPISTGLQQRLNALPLEAQPSVLGSTGVPKNTQSPNRDGILRPSVGGPTSPYGSNISPRTHGGLAKITAPSSFNASPVSPPPRSSSLRKRPAVFDPTNGRQDTDRSTSSSSILPDTSSSSSVASLASPSAADEQSDATSTLISSDNNTLRGGSLKSPLSPHFPSQQDVMQPNSPTTFTSHSNPSSILKGSARIAVDRGPDSPLSQIYTGHHPQQSSLASVGQSTSQTSHSTRTGLGGQAGISDSKGVEQSLASSTSSTTSTSSRSPSSMMRKPGMTIPAPQLLRTWSDHQPMLSPAFPDSPLVQDFSDGGYPSTTNGRVPAPLSALQPFQESHEDVVDKKPNNNTPTRSVTPVVAARSPTPTGRATTQVSSQPLPSPSLKSSFLRHQHQRSISESTGEGHSESTTVKINGTSKPDGNGMVERTPPSSRTGVVQTFSPKPVTLHSHSRNMSSTSSVGTNAVLPPRSSPTSSRPRQGVASPQLSLQPIFNTSSSSLDSMGSSFHSMEGDRRSLLQLEGEGYTEDKRDGQFTTEDDATESDYEDLLGLWGGLTKKDVAAIHDRLVGAAALKASIAPSPPAPSPRPTSPPFVTRRPSHNRQQGGSISQSLKSMSQDSEVSSQKDSVLRDNTTKADALLRAMVQSLPPLEPVSLANSTSSVAGANPSTSGISPASLDSFKAVIPAASKAEDAMGTKLQSGVTKGSPIPSLNDPDLRKRALTEALFGDTSPGTGPSPSTSEPKDHPYATKDLALEDLESIGRAKSTPSPRVPDADLVAAVTRKAVAATEALKNPAGKGDMPLKRQDTKRINGRLISIPQLLSSTTSFDTVPIATSQAHNPSTPSLVPDATKPGEKTGKLSLRIKKLREKLKPSRSFVPNGEELTPWTYEARSASPSSTRQGSISTLLVDAVPRQPSPQLEAAPASLVSPRGPRPLSPSSTTPRGEVSSPSPSIKGFISRLRSNSKRDTEGLSSPLNGNSTTTSFLSRSSSKKKSISPKPSTSSLLSSPKKHVASEHTIEEENERDGQEPHVVDLTSPREEPSELWFDLATPDVPEVNHDDAAVRQLFEAASNLGLDHSALTDLLARSTSISSKTSGWSSAVTQSNSVMTTTTPNTAGPRATDGVPSADGPKRALSSRVGALLSRVVEHPGGLTATANADQVIIRRTLIFPSDGDSSLMRKGSAGTSKTGKKKRGSTTSVQSSQSVQDRSPTPPPKRASKRFSKDPGPPIPSLPAQFTFPRGEGSLGIGLLGQSARSHQSTSSAYGSLFDMYGEDSPAQSVPPSPGSSAVEGMGQALEVVELSNGEVVWSVVDAMRSDILHDDDGSSLNQSRHSTTSDTSYAPRDGVQVLFKEHRRMGSKGSATSAISAVSSFRKFGTNRPETKVFFSSAAHIGRLIESMSRGADAGSFNIVPAPPDSPLPPDASTLARFGGKNSPALSMTDNSYSVEDRLDHLLKLTSRGHA